MDITLEQYKKMEEDATIERYSEGECWKLAYALNDVSGWPIVAVAAIATFGISWVHVLNSRPDGLFVDIQGEHDLADVWDAWEGLLYGYDEDDKQIVTIHRADFQETLLEDPKEIESDTYVLAKEIFEKYKEKRLNEPSKLG